MKLDYSFYRREDVTAIARDLLGKELITQISGVVTSGIIVETEAYSWREKGCHAYNNKKTPRNEVMFESGGLSYVYLCYGIHHLFNVVTNSTNKADAVLVRALEPAQGAKFMLKRINARSIQRITSGPGKLTKALGINRKHNGIDLVNSQIWIEDSGKSISGDQIDASARIGIDYAGDDALLPWRFTIRNNPWISR